MIVGDKSRINFPTPNLFLTKQYWYALLIIILLLLLIGFIAGKALVESQVRSRFQGVKVW